MSDTEFDVLLLYVPREYTPFGEHVTDRQLRRIEAAFTERGQRVAVRDYKPWTISSTFSEVRARVVLNLAYGFVDVTSGIIESQPEVAARIEGYTQTLTGAMSDAQAVAQDKLRAACQLGRVGVRSPRVLNRDDAHLPDFALRKPRHGACRRGVGFVDPHEAASWKDVPDTFLLQEYIDGSEWTVGVIEREGQVVSLMPLKLEFVDQSPSAKFASYSSFPWHEVPSAEDPHELGSLSRSVFRWLRLRDYARFDYRVDAHGPVLLDANSLPNLDPDVSLLPTIAAYSNLSFEDLVTGVVDSALRRVALT